jgi:hypothetical protein
MKRSLVILSLLFIFAGFNVKPVLASHYMGGEITWECKPSGKFVFTLKYYRECNGITFPNTITLNSNSPAGSITMPLVTGWPKDITPQCNPNTAFTHITCANVTQSNMGAVEEYIYRSAEVQISGVPPVNGWVFYHASAARNPATNIVGQPAWALRAIMYPYNNQNTYPCFDNSPVFAEVARSVIDAGYPFTYNHNATDAELDSLTFVWGEPWIANNSPLTAYVGGYSYTNPLPGPAQNPNNVAAVMDTFTGEISFTSYTPGAFVTSTKVTAYKCGIKVAEIWRDIQVVLRASTGGNLPPVVTAPFPNNPVGAQFVDTVYAGDLVTFALSATDFQLLPNGMPQTMKIEATGLQFGNFVAPSGGGGQPTLSTTAGCLNPPCATLTPAPGPNYPLTAQFGVQTAFSWQTDCSHLASNVGCGATSNVYNFVLKVMDDYCPFPAIAISTVTVVVLPKPTLLSPEIHTLQVRNNGDVKLRWVALEDTMNTFGKYLIFSSNNPTGPFNFVDSVTHIDTANYLHVGANANAGPVYYQVRTLSGCPGHLDTSDVLDPVSTIFLTVTNMMNGTANLNWNPTHNPLLPSSSGIYEVYRGLPNSPWVYIGSTQGLTWDDTITICNSDVFYRIEIVDTLMSDATGPTLDRSISNADGDLFSDVVPPNIPIIDSVSVGSLLGGSGSIISWDQNAWLDTDGYIVYLDVNGTMTPIDTVYGDTNTIYVDVLNDPCSGNGYNTYTVAAFDSCGNVSALAIEHNTMNLTLVKDICDDMITVSWNPYNNMVNGLGGYEIWVSENQLPAILIATPGPADVDFVHTGLTDGTEYCYTLKALDATGTITSTSCQKCMIADKPIQAQFVYLKTATVLPNNAGIEVRVFTDTSGKVSDYKLERLDNGTWTYLKSITPDPTNPVISTIDNSAPVRIQNTSYRVIVVDSCGVDILTSNIGRNVFLTVNANTATIQNELSWTDYSAFAGTPTTYNVYRSVDGVWDPNPINPTPISYTSGIAYVDDVNSLTNTSGGIFQYYVVAIEGPGSFQGIASETARSNEVKVIQNPRVYVPSAFNPESNDPDVNRFFPQGNFISDQNYEFVIYNRWGDIVFESSKVGEGWDGELGNGEEAPQGVYTYYLQFTTSEGILYEKRGTVTILR